MNNQLDLGHVYWPPYDLLSILVVWWLWLDFPLLTSRLACWQSWQRCGMMSLCSREECCLGRPCYHPAAAVCPPPALALFHSHIHSLLTLWALCSLSPSQLCSFELSFGVLKAAWAKCCSQCPPFEPPPQPKASQAVLKDPAFSRQWDQIRCVKLRQFHMLAEPQSVSFCFSACI